MPKTVTERFVDEMLALRYAGLPAAAVDTAKHVALDGLAVMLAGATEPLGIGRITLDYVKALGGAPFQPTGSRPSRSSSRSSVMSTARSRAAGSTARSRSIRSPTSGAAQPDLERLLPRVKLVADPSIPNDFDRMHATVRITLTTRERFEETVQRLSGRIGAPLSEAQRLSKFHACAPRARSRRRRARGRARAAPRHARGRARAHGSGEGGVSDLRRPRAVRSHFTLQRPQRNRNRT